MLDTQRNFLDYLDKMGEDFNKINLPMDTIGFLKKAIQNTEMLIPVTGAFSAGKSTLINSFLGDQYLPVGITPETALATELHYSERDFIEAVKKDGSTVQFGVDKMEKIKENAGNYKFIRIFLDNKKLQEIEPLVLVDMPGFESPLDIHNQAIMSYINRGVHYIVLISVESGNITRSMRNQLTDIREFQRDFSFFISKANLRSLGEGETIVKRVEEQLIEYFDISHIPIPIREEGGEALRKIVKAIDPERLFKNLFIQDLKEHFLDALDTINTKVSALRNDREKNKEIIEELKNEIDKLQASREKKIEEAKGKYSTGKVDRIINAVGRAASNSVDELTDAAMSGGQKAFKAALSEIIRHTLISETKEVITQISGHITDDFSSELKGIDSALSSLSLDDSWLEKITESTKNMLNKGTSALQDTVNKWDTKRIGRYKAITAVLAVTTKVVAPLLEIVIFFLPDILKAIFGISQKAKQKEQIRNQILTITLPGVKRKLREELTTVLQQQVAAMVQEIGNEFEKRLLKKQEEITAAEKEKQTAISDIETEIAKYEDVRKSLTASANSILYEEDQDE